MSQDSGTGKKKRTVQVKRRRRTTETSTRRRAQAPSRETTDEKRQSSRPPKGSGAGSRPPVTGFPSMGVGSGGGRSGMLMIGLLLLALICIVPIYLFFGRGDSDETSSVLPTQEYIEAEVPQIAVEPTTPAVTFVPPSISTEGQTWLVMLYQDADDKILEHDIYVDLNEAERVGSSDRVHIVAQVDRYRAGYQGDGNWQ
ncbi:MAG: hypothetical protein U9R58_15925 [Chloroflexota bacterium]|nr:hypothetical protein [Chloroflexota bacterium]